MALHIDCPACGYPHEVSDDKAGLRLRCQACRTVMSIPLRNVTTKPARAAARGTWSSRLVAYSLLTLAAGVVFYSVWATGLLEPAPPRGRPPVSLPADKAPVPEAMANQRAPAPEPPLPQPPAPATPATPLAPVAAPPSSDPSKAAQLAFMQARVEFVRNGQSSKFIELLQQAAPSLPTLAVTTGSNELHWNRFTQSEAGAMLQAFRFTSPLDAVADFCWGVASPDDFGTWQIFAEKGPSNGFRYIRLLQNVPHEGVEMPEQHRLILQELSGAIQPGQSYIVYFMARSLKTQPVHVAIRLTPAAQRPQFELDARTLARRLGLQRADAPAPSSSGRLVGAHRDVASFVGFTADGAVLSTGWPALKAWPADAGEASEFESDRNILQAALSPDRRLLALKDGPPFRIRIWDVEQRQVAVELPPFEGVPSAMTFAPDSHSLYVFYQRGPIEGADLQGELICWKVPEAEILHRGRADGAVFDALTCSAAALVAGGVVRHNDALIGGIQRWKLDLTEPSPPLVLKGGVVQQLVFSPDGGRLLVPSYQGVLRLVSADLQVEREFALETRPLCAAWRPDGRLVAIGCDDEAVRLLDPGTGRFVARLEGHRHSVVDVGWSADGNRLVSDDLDGRIWTWDLDSVEIPKLPAEPLTDSLGISFQPIPAGEFQMGTPLSFRATFLGHHQSLFQERPVHRVRITRPFLMGVHEVTIGQFRRFVEDSGHKTDAERTRGRRFIAQGQPEEYSPSLNWKSPGYEVEDDFPVSQVTHADAVAFCAWASQKENAVYRLPTEAEWEYACRAGSRELYSCVYDSLGIAYTSNASDQALTLIIGRLAGAGRWNDGHAYAAPVGSYLPNAFGLHDMQGNVFEICNDWFAPRYYEASPTDDPQGPATGEERVSRGGAFTWTSEDCRCGRRLSTKLSDPTFDEGFRVVREIPR